MGGPGVPYPDFRRRADAPFTAPSAPKSEDTPGRRTAAGEGRADVPAPSDDRREDRPDDSGARPRNPRFRLGGSRSGDDAPPPRASARFPDTAPTVGREAAGGGAMPQTPPHRAGVPAETPTETTTRLRPIPAEPVPGPAPEAALAAEAETEPEAETGPEPGQGPRTGPRAPRPASTPPSGPADRAPAPAGPDPAFSWNSPAPPGHGRPRVSFGEPEGYDGPARPRRLGGRPRPQAVAAAVCLVLGVGLLTGAVTGSWLAEDSGDKGARSAFTEAGDLWHSVPVDQLFPPTVQGKGAGPGGADRSWTRVAVAPDSGCAGAFDRLLAKVLDPVGCSRLLRATYTDATQSYVTTVGLLFTKADAAAMTALASRFEKEGLGRRADLMPLPYAAKDTVAADFGAEQRASWTVSVLTDAPVVVYAVSGWADGRTVDEPEPAEEATESGATSAPAQAGLGHEAQGLADRVERALRKNVGPATEHPS
ncbi:hypothetical protein [Streptomyces sp. AC512_CC834]|uniref:hypothetical protein n=1 Tax=Streptomyces sp. AC512_CC834 TaxID=2823691 RepID=UPI0027E54E48|nr:hypothetical protein [Streptomyces sp. AC512_CC834]